MDAKLQEEFEFVNNCIDAVGEIVGEALTVSERSALASMIWGYRKADKEDSRRAAFASYLGAVDFLWMAYRITHVQKMDLLDLI